jgi:monolysocardiolipin acyltransferase
MPDTRKYLRFLPRPGKRISITIGDPITNKIAPLVDEWRRVARSTPGRLGVGGSWSGKEGIETALGSIQDAQTKIDLAAINPERKERSRGTIGGGKEESIRIKICQVLTDELVSIGNRIEKREGKDKRAWRNAVKREL